MWPGDRRGNPTEATYPADDVAIVQKDVAQAAAIDGRNGGHVPATRGRFEGPAWELMHQLSRGELRAMNMATIDGSGGGGALPTVPS
jgi:hypothetical protein